jgi:hypothetical protein
VLSSHRSVLDEPLKEALEEAPPFIYRGYGG